MKKLILGILLFFIGFTLSSCEGYTWKYKTLIQYHYEGETEVHTINHDFTIGYNSSVEEITVKAFANSFDNGHKVELVYAVTHGGIIQENAGRISYYKYQIMQVPDKRVLIDKVETRCLSKQKD